jgi:hypothetical protein
LEEITHGEIRIVRPPLHTALSLRPSIDTWPNTLGGTAFIALLVSCGGIGLIIFSLYMRSLVKKEIDNYNERIKLLVRLSIIATFLLFSFIIIIQYIANILGFWTIDFESTISLIESTIIFIPLIGMRIFKSMGYELKFSFKHKGGQNFFNLLVALIVFLSLFSPLGLYLRTNIKGYADVINIKGDPIELTILANNVYNFIIAYGSLPKTILLDSRFSGHYLYLPLMYKGFKVAIYDYYQQIIAESSDISRSFSIILNNGDFTLYLENVIDVYYIYDGKYVVMPY